jgi:hypothetical protein
MAGVVAKIKAKIPAIIVLFIALPSIPVYSLLLPLGTFFPLNMIAGNK